MGVDTHRYSLFAKAPLNRACRRLRAVADIFARIQAGDPAVTVTRRVCPDFAPNCTSCD